MELLRHRRTALWAAIVFFGAAGTASPALAYEVLDNAKLRFGTGSEASVNANGNLQQPFYYDGIASQWYKLTYSSYPLDNAIGIDGTGTNEWNTSGTIVQNSALTGQVRDVSGFTVTSGSKGYGTIVSTGTVTIAGKTLELRNTYTLGANQSFIKIVTRLKNTSGSTVSNVRVWVGTRDDWVGTSDGPTKQRGNLVNGAFVMNSNATDRAAALQIFSGATGVLFYSTSPKAHTSVNYCCSFSNAYQQNPATSANQLTGDGSYALFVRMADLANGASEEFTWYYAAGELANLGTIVNDVAQQASTVTVTGAAGTGGSISPTTVQVTSGATTSLTVTPNTGYDIASVQGCSGSLSGTTYTTGAITTACTVTASFSLKTYAVTVSAGTGGSIAPGSTTADHGSTKSFTVTPAAGYSIASVQGCGGSLVGNTYTTAAITAACTVTASFNRNSYSVTATAGVGGSAGPANATVLHGETADFTVTPAVGFSVANVQGCSGTLSGNTYTTGAIASACAITATFALNYYAVTAAAGAGGSVTPANVAVAHGSSTTFTLTADTGYSVAGVAGCGGSLNGNTYTTGLVSGNCSVSATFVLTRPRFEPASPAAYDLQATALTMPLSQNIAPKAFDGQGHELSVTLVDEAARYEPGEHVLRWRAQDSNGLTTTVEQVLRVWPTVSMGNDVKLGLRQGNSGAFSIVLNGHSPVYPFGVNYTVSGGTAYDDLDSGRAEFAAGETSKEVYFAVLQTPVVGTPDQEVQVALAEDVNRGKRAQLTVRLVMDNAAPRVTLAATQGGQSYPAFDRAGGIITVLADVQDSNSNDTHTFQWFSPNGASVATNNGELTLQADSLTAGIHRFEVLVTDSGTPALSSRGVLDVVLQKDLPVLPAGAQEWVDNGLPDHPDYNPPSRNVLPERAGELQHFVIEGDPGVKLSLGPNALQSGLSQAEVHAATNSPIGPDTVTNVGGYFDFIVEALTQVGQSINIVVPQRAAIPAHPVYRKYDTHTRGWKSFTENGANTLASAPGAEGFCPPPGSTDYRAGLNPGDWCVRLTMTDGGPNDDDGQANGVVLDPGGVGALVAVEVTAKGSGSSSAGGGGGSMDMFGLIFGLFTLALRRIPRTAKAMLSLSILALSIPVTAFAQEHSWASMLDHTYVGAQAGHARGETTEATLNTRLSAAGYDAVAHYGDRNRDAWRLFVGHQWNKFLETQLGYTDLGKVTATFTGNVTDVNAFLNTVNRLHPRSADGIELSLLGRFPLTSRFMLTGRGGFLRWDSSYNSADNVAASDRAEGAGVDPFLGAGVEFALFHNLSLTGEWTQYGVDGEKIRFAGMGLTYRLGKR